MSTHNCYPGGPCAMCPVDAPRAAPSGGKAVVSFEVSAAEARALVDVAREYFPDNDSPAALGSTVLALVRFALAHMADPRTGSPRFPPEPREAAATALRSVAGGTVRILDRPGHPEGSLLVWRDVVTYAGGEIGAGLGAGARLTELPPHVPVSSGPAGGPPVRRAISLLDLERLGRDLDPVKHTKAIARIHALVTEARS